MRVVVVHAIPLHPPTEFRRSELATKIFTPAGAHSPSHGSASSQSKIGGVQITPIGLLINESSICKPSYFVSIVPAGERCPENLRRRSAELEAILNLMKRWSERHVLQSELSMRHERGFLGDLVGGDVEQGEHIRSDHGARSLSLGVWLQDRCRQGFDLPEAEHLCRRIYYKDR